jgi:hypothetical protein
MGGKIPAGSAVRNGRPFRHLCEEKFVNITCPRCGFSRPLPDDRLPRRPVIATCPQCACRFRFAPDAGVLEVLAPVPGAAQEPPQDMAQTPPAAPGGGDDPLPPGAIVPGRPAPPAAGAEKADSSREDEEAAAPARKAARPRWDEDAAAEDAGRNAARDRKREGREAEAGFDQEAGEDNPWRRAPEPDGWPAAFYHTCMRVMFGSQRFFAALRPGEAQTRALIFYLIISAVQVAVERVWSGVFLSLMAPSAASDPQLEKMLILLSPQMSLPMTVLLKLAVSVVQIYVLSALIQFTYGFVASKRQDFSLVFQVMAYASAPGLLCIVPLLGSVVGFIWSFACILVGCRAALRLSWPQTLMGLAPILLLLAPLLLQMAQATQF